MGIRFSRRSSAVSCEARELFCPSAWRLARVSGASLGCPVVDEVFSRSPASRIMPRRQRDPDRFYQELASRVILFGRDTRHSHAQLTRYRYRLGRHAFLN